MCYVYKTLLGSLLPPCLGGYCVEVGRRANRNEYDSEALSLLPSTKIAVFASTV